MKRFAISMLVLAVFGVQAAEPGPATAPPSNNSAAPAATNGQSTPPSKEALQQAFDGAMTCSALTALLSQSAKPDEAWRWKNRSFAFGMLARNFYRSATQSDLSGTEMDNALTTYANSLQGMGAKDREPFDTGCARKYAQIDQLCEVNHCPNSAPGSAPATGAPAAPSATSK